MNLFWFPKFRHRSRYDHEWPGTRRTRYLHSPIRIRLLSCVCSGALEWCCISIVRRLGISLPPGGIKDSESAAANLLASFRLERPHRTPAEGSVFDASIQVHLLDVAFRRHPFGCVQ